MGTIQREFVIDFVELGDMLLGSNSRGRLGMCRLPGYEVIELPADVDALATARATLVVSLLQTEELHLLLGLMEPDIGFFPRMARAPFQHRHFPIRNGGVPSSMRELAATVDALCDELSAGGTVVLHCVAGHGRTGLVAACCLVKLGVDANTAIVLIRRHRPGTIESAAQEAFVHEYESALAAHP